MRSVSLLKKSFLQLILLHVELPVPSCTFGFFHWVGRRRSRNIKTKQRPLRFHHSPIHRALDLVNYREKGLKMSVDDRVSTSQIQKAVKSLLVHSQKKKKETVQEGKTLFADEDENMWLVVTTKTMHPSLTLKPQRM
jgi:hypothetical protein